MLEKNYITAGLRWPIGRMNHRSISSRTVNESIWMYLTLWQSGNINSFLRRCRHIVEPPKTPYEFDSWLFSLKKNKNQESFGFKMNHLTSMTFRLSATGNGRVCLSNLNGFRDFLYSSGMIQWNWYSFASSHRSVVMGIGLNVITKIESISTVLYRDWVIWLLISKRGRILIAWDIHGILHQSKIICVDIIFRTDTCLHHLDEQCAIILKLNQRKDLCLYWVTA